jgi:hypothetical protein
MRMRHSVICGLPFCTVFFKLFYKRHDYWDKVVEHKMCVLIFSTNFVWNISHYKKKWASYYQKCILLFMWRIRYSFPILMKLEFTRQFLENYSSIKFHGYASSGSRIVPCGQKDGRTDMTKLIVTFRNFENAPKNSAMTKTLLQSDSVSKRILWCLRQ